MDQCPIYTVPHNICVVDAMMFESELHKSVLFTRPAATVDEYVGQLNDVLTHLLDKCTLAPTRCLRPQKPITKWLSAEAVEASAHVSASISESRTDHYRRRIQESGSDYRQRWRIVNKLLHSKDLDKTRTDDEN